MDCELVEVLQRMKACGKEQGAFMES